MKPKILGMSSKSYPEGRIDSFKIDENEGQWESIVDCLVGFGFDDESIRANIDFTLEDRGYIFFYLNPKLKVHLSAEESEDFFTVRFDTSIPREEILKIMAKHFQFSE
jgi:hypothetical protein